MFAGPVTAEHRSPMQIIPLKKGENIKTEPEYMLACKNVALKTGVNDSIPLAIFWSVLGGESFFINTYTAVDDEAWIALEETFKGQVVNYTLKSTDSLILGKGAYIASDSNVKIRPYFSGLFSWIKGLGVTKIKASLQQGNEGRVFFNTKDGIIKVLKVTKEDGPVVVDNDNLLGYSESLKVTMRKLGGMKTTLFSGEGFVNEFTGDGTVFVGTVISKEEKNNIVERVVDKILEKFYDFPPKVAVFGVLATLIWQTSRVAAVSASGTSYSTVG